MICIRRGLSTGVWRHTIKHEVAHFAPGSHRHGPGFLKARAKQGDRYAKAALRKAGLMRCAKHVWLLDRERSRKVTRTGIAVTYGATCRQCGREI